MIQILKNLKSHDTEDIIRSQIKINKKTVNKDIAIFYIMENKDIFIIYLKKRGNTFYFQKYLHLPVLKFQDRYFKIS